MDALLKKMQSLANKAREQAYAPYSNFCVGACIQSKSGQLFTGCNVENVSFGLTLCAEASAVSELIKSGEREIVQVVIVAASESVCVPCGACRQRLMEFASDETKVHSFNKQGEYNSFLLKELFPFPFSKKELGE